jgi:hypothetical protein
MNSEWINMGGTTHFCPDCYSINDEDKIIIDGNRHKTQINIIK